MKLSAIFKTTLLPLTLSVALLPGPFGNAQAAMITTSQAVSRLSLDASRQTVAEYMSRTDVQNELVKQGVDPQEAGLRVASLSETEIQNLAMQIEQSTAGGDSVVGLLTVVLLVVLIIFLIQRI